MFAMRRCLRRRRMIEDVTDPQDPRISDYHNLKDNKLANERGLFMAEGREVVRVLLRRSPLETRSVLVNARAFDSMRDVLERPENASLSVFRAQQVVMNQIVGFHIHRGCLAAGLRPAQLERWEDWLASEQPSVRPTLLVLDGVNNHDNVGGLFRSAAAFGACGVVLVSDSVDPLYRKAIRVSMGASLLVPFTRAESALELLGQLERQGVFSVALTPDASAVDVRDVRVPTQSRALAIWLGSEGPGLAPEVKRACDGQVQIPMTGAIDSLNVSTAGAIAMHALMPRPQRDFSPR